MTKIALNYIVGVKLKRTTGHDCVVGKALPLLLGLVMILCSWTSSSAFADEVHSRYVAVIMKEYTNAAFSEKGIHPMKPGQVVWVEDRDRDTVEVLPSSYHPWSRMVIPRAIIATAASFKKITKWTGDSVVVVETDGPGYRVEYSIGASGAIHGTGTGIEGTQNGHLYRLGNIIWLKDDGVHDLVPTWQSILLVLPGEHLCVPGTDDSCPPAGNTP